MLNKALLIAFCLNVLMIGYIAGKWTVTDKLESMVAGPSSQLADWKL